MSVELRQGDNRTALRRMIDNGEFVDSVVCDPPYGLVSVAKRFGGKNAAPAQFGKDGAFSRASAGFMGLRWDGTGIERDPEFWSLVWQVMKPGAYIIAFSSSRTYGYMQVAMEAAGFITHPMFGWVFNTGFPKGHPVDKAIDAQMMTGGSGPKNIRQRDMGDDYRPHVLAGTPSYGDGRMSRGADQDWDYDRAPDLHTEEARQWRGWKTGTQSLKPALEPVYFGQKPFSEKTGALNILKHGVGAVNIDACRVACEQGGRPLREVHALRDGVEYNGLSLAGRLDGSLQSSKAVGTTDSGRYPANLVHDGSPEVVALFPQTSKMGVQTQPIGTGGIWSGVSNTPCGPQYGDTGSAARFFNSFPHEGPIMCYPKAGKKDRAGSKHATVKPIGLMQHYVRLVTPPGGVVLDPFAGTGTTGQAALNEGMSCVLMEAEAEYARDIRRRFGLVETVSDKMVRMVEALR